MTQFRRVGRTSRVVFASAAILALSLVGYGNAATASAPAPLAVGAEPASDLAGPAKGLATITDSGGIANGENGKKPPASGQPWKVVDQGCRVSAPTKTPPDAPVKPTKGGGGPPVTVRTDPSMGGGSAPTVGANAGNLVHATRPGVVAVPELRQGPRGVKGFLTSDPGGCIAPEPVAKPPVKKRPTGRLSPGVGGVPEVVTTCVDPATDLPLGGGASPAQPNPGALTEPGAGQAEDQAVDDQDATCVQSVGDEPVSSSTDEEPPSGPSSVADDSVAAQEAGAAGFTR